MANEDYSGYRKFLEDFAATVNPTDQLPVRIPGYTITEVELSGEIIDWTFQYLSARKCPQTLIAPIVQIILEETKQSCRKTPALCGYNPDSRVYQPLILMQTVISRINDVCQRLLDNSQLDLIPPPPPASQAPPRYAVSTLKNIRRKMEDRHVIIDDFNAVFGIENAERASYYAIFDGHAGVDAASYGVSQLHSFLAASPKYPLKPAEAMRDAFVKTDNNFLIKCKKQDIVSGTTALCALYRPVEKQIYVGWLGDSKALLVTEGNIMQIVTPHKPEVESEKIRIESQGGCVMIWGGSYRVNGTLAVSRAIGDLKLKPYVSGEPDIVCIPLSGNEDFLILACDGLWDHVSEDDVAFYVYKQVRENPDRLDQVTTRLIELSLVQGSTDNISIIVVFLKDPHQISTSSWPSAVIPSPLDNMETTYDNSNGGAFNNSNQEIFQKSNLLHDFGLDMDFKNTNVTVPLSDNLNNIESYTDNETASALEQKPTEHVEFIFGNSPITKNNISTNGKRRADVFDDEDDFGPETDVDAVDEAMLSPTSQEECTEQKVIDFDTKKDINQEALNPFEIHVKNDGIKPNDLGLDINHIEDNKFLETVVEGVESEIKRDIDFSEKREFSFECEEFEKELNTIGDATTELTGMLKDMAVELIIPNDVITTPDVESFVVPETEHEPIVDQTAVENVVVPESGEDSEDEWNYIKVNKEVEESHGIAQALAESEEFCAYSLDEQTQDSEILQVETNAEPEVELTEEEMMASQLNPDAKEFVPTSPQHTSPLSSPFSNGGTFLRSDLLLQNDAVLSQSPRKFAPMDNIQLPSEVDFDKEIAKRPADLEDDTVTEINNSDFQRPGSSNSQCSYQEMNLKEAMHADEKQEYAPDNEVILDSVSESNDISNGEHDHLTFIESLGKSMRKQDPMLQSFYNDDSNNPFVDMNSVQVLPISDDDENARGIESPTYILEGSQGTHYSIQDTEFGMNGAQSELLSPGPDVIDELSRPEDDQYSPLSETKGLDELLTQSTGNGDNDLIESDKPESDLSAIERTNEISIKEQITCTEVTSLLNEMTISERTNSPQYEAEHFVENIKTPTEDKYVDSTLSPTSPEFNPNPMSSDNLLTETDIKDFAIEDSAESDICLKQIDVPLASKWSEQQDESITQMIDKLCLDDSVGHKQINTDVESLTNKDETNETVDDNLMEPIDIKNEFGYIDNKFVGSNSDNDNILINKHIDEPIVQTELIVSAPTVKEENDVKEECIIETLDVQIAPLDCKVEPIDRSTDLIDIKQEPIDYEIEINDIKSELKDVEEATTVDRVNEPTYNKTITEDNLIEPNNDIKLEENVSESKENVISAAVAGVAVAAVAAAVTTTVAKTAATNKTTKKPDAKARTTTTAPNVVKKTASTILTKTTTKPVASTTTATTKAAPTPRPRTVAKPTSEKKAAPPPPAASKKPLANGDIKSPHALVPIKKPTDSLKPASTATSTKSSSTQLKPAAIRSTLQAKATPLVAKTSTTTSKLAAATTKAPTTKPLPPATKPRSVTSAPSVIGKTSATRPASTSPNKPITDKLTKETTNKMQVTSARTSGSTMSNKTAPAVKSTSTTSTVKKIDVKSPTSAKTISKSTLTTVKKTSTISPTTHTSTASSAAAKRPSTTTATRTILAPKKTPTGPSPIKKRVTSTTTTTSSTTTTTKNVINEEKAIKNTNLITDIEQISKTIDLVHSINEKHDFNKLDNELRSADDVPPHQPLDQSQNAVIDLSAD